MFSVVDQPARSQTLIDLGALHPAVQRIRGYSELLPDPRARPTAPTNLSRAAKNSRTARSFNSGGDFLTFGMLLILSGCQQPSPDPGRNIFIDNIACGSVKHRSAVAAGWIWRRCDHQSSRHFRASKSTYNPPPASLHGALSESTMQERRPLAGGAVDSSDRAARTSDHDLAAAISRA